MEASFHRQQVASSLTHVSPTGRGIIIARNPIAGYQSGQQLAEQLANLLEQRGFDVNILSDIDEIINEVTQRFEQGDLRTVVAAGGDGTIALIANQTPEGVPIAPFPLGTENLLARHFGLQADPQLACDMICHGRLLRLDAGRALDRIFFVVASCGFDAEVVRRVHAKRHGHIQRLSYIKPIIETIRNYRYPELRVYCDDSKQPTCARWVFVSNTPNYALGLTFSPEATETDGLLDVCTFKQGTLWNGMMYLGAVALGQHSSWNDCTLQRARRIRIEADEPVAIEMDGDPAGQLPIDIEILPGRLSLVLPT